MCDKILQHNADFALIGDLNSNPMKSNAIEFICDTYSLTNLIKTPTCNKGPNPSLIDVILVSNSRKYSKSLNSNCPLSDFHNIIGASTRRFAPVMKPRKITYRSYKNFDDEDFKFDLCCAPFHVAEIFDDIDDTAWFTSKLLSNIIDSHAPIKVKTVKKDSVPYMNSKMRKALYQRNMVRNKFRIFGKKHWEQNRKKRNELVAIRKSSLQIYFSENCSKIDKTFWSTISPFMSDKKFRSSESIILQENGSTMNDTKVVTNKFNDYFCSIASSIGFDDVICDTRSAIEKHSAHPSIAAIKNKHGNIVNSFKFHPVSENHIKKKLQNINIRKATGYDNIPGKLLKLGSSELCIPIANLMNTCLSKNVFPGNMKCAEVSPIYKKDDNLMKNNYRPVSILTSLSKIFESVMNDQMYGYLSKILETLLSAFRKGYSCQSLLIKFIEDAKSALDKGEYVGALFMDLSKAFDCLPHGLLIAKLHAYGFSESSCELLASYLTDRNQRVKIGNTRSDWLPLSKGVPQGSILGPLLFNVFMNDLFYFIERCLLYNYADDNFLSKAARHINELLLDLKHDSKITTTWFRDNGMQANPSKFQFMVASSKDIGEIKISIDENTTLTSEPHIKALGVTIDSKLDFSKHVSDICKKAARQLNALARISRFLNPASKMILYNSFIMSNFNYCPNVWHFCGKGNNSKLEKIQSRALRIIFNDYDSDYDELISQSRTDKLLVSRLKKILIEVFKTLKKSNPPYLHSLYTLKETPYDLRNEMSVIQPKRNTITYGIRSLAYIGAKLWNDMKFDFDNFEEMELCTFKQMLMNWKGPDSNSSYSYV